VFSSTTTKINQQKTADAFERANRLAKEKEIDSARDVLLDLIKHLSESKLAKNFFVVGYVKYSLLFTCLYDCF